MPATTQGLRYPVETDSPDVPRDIKNLAEDVNAKFLGWLTGTIGTRPAASIINRIFRASDTGIVYRDTGTAWEAWYGPGDLKLSAATAVPDGWLTCDGSAVSRTTFAALFAAIGTAYGVGDGSTTFNVPDYRGRSPVGAGTGAGLTARSVGQTLGEENHLLSTGEMPAHTHTQNASGTIKVQENGAGPSAPATTPVQTGSTGGGGTHNNMQPSAVCNVWIKT